MKGKQVALVTPGVELVGGTEVYVGQAARALMETGARVRVYVQGSAPAGSSELEVVASGAALSEAVSPRTLASRREEARRLAREIADWADVVVFHRLTPLDLLCRLRRHTPTLVAVHTAEDTCPAGSRYLPVSRRQCDRDPGPGCVMVSRHERCLAMNDGRPFAPLQVVRAAVSPWLKRLALRWASGWLYNSRATRALAERHLGVARRGWVVHPPLVPSTAPGEPPLRRAELVCYVGRLVAGKGAEDALRACARLPGTELVICGDGPLRAELEAIARSLGVPATFRGWCSSSEVTGVLRAAGCLLVPSRCFEAFGQVGPQAIQEGCPVVAYASGGTVEWCQAPFGRLVPLGDELGLARETAWWLRQVAEGLDTTGWRGLAQSAWGPQRFASEYVAAVRGAMASGPAP